MPLCFFINPHHSLQPTMPAGAIWTAPEETALVEFLVNNKAEAGDGGNFKTSTFQQAVSHITTLHERGPIKTIKSTWSKWISVNLSTFYFITMVLRHSFYFYFYFEHLNFT